jgi:hypothetical protein
MLVNGCCKNKYKLIKKYKGCSILASNRVEQVVVAIITLFEPLLNV